ncbi:MAG: hypothetical protein CHACPFDD_02533 [Phycisphaerae bacterium]|nr:hypothetical protein [Phycisphaerae bacterium]
MIFVPVDVVPHGKWVALRALVAAAVAAAALAGAPRIELTFDPAVCDQPYSGRVYVVASTLGGGEPRQAVGWFNTQPFFALPVEGWKPGEPLAFDAAKSDGFPAPLSELPKGKYRAQAIIDLNGGSHDVLNAPGNAYSEVVEFEHDPQNPAAEPLALRISKRIKPRELKDSTRVKFIKLRSDLLSRFYGRDTYMEAAVGLPEAYDADANPQRKFPSIYVISGFGGTMSSAKRMVGTKRYADLGLDIVVVYIDADCPTGHHVFADSANNGPRGEALVKELIPHLEREFRIIADAGARYVTGHSSGGWSSLWLQVAYPDVFGGVWSTSPDPVDFSAFQRVNVYDPADNMYLEPDGSPRSLSRKVMGMQLISRSFSAMEEVFGRGGQLQSFEAVFSPRGADGKPLKLWDRQSGKLDMKVAEAWKKYDIRMTLENNWPTLGPKLKGKLHLFCGDQDTFHLELAFFKLRDALQRLGSDAYVEVVPGADHGLSRDAFERATRQIAEQFEKYRAAHGG